jgi:hypothetical protein
MASFVLLWFSAKSKDFLRVCCNKRDCYYIHYPCCWLHSTQRFGNWILSVFSYVSTKSRLSLSYDLTKLMEIKYHKLSMLSDLQFRLNPVKHKSNLNSLKNSVPNSKKIHHWHKYIKTVNFIYSAFLWRQLLRHVC